MNIIIYTYVYVIRTYEKRKAYSVTMLRNWCVVLEKEAVKFRVSVKGRQFLAFPLEEFCYR